ncbi:MAG: sugar dehydrogenase, partial [Saprospiraceae bacterium]
MSQFKNKRALIIGGTSGIGKATANALLNDGAIV